MAQNICTRNDEEEIFVHEISNLESILGKRRHRLHLGQRKRVKGRAHVSEHVVEAESRAQVWLVKQTEGFSLYNLQHESDKQSKMRSSMFRMGTPDQSQTLSTMRH